MKKFTYWQVFRLIFVIFFLYLLGYVFYYWDGFSKYGTFSEYIPSVALVSLFWVIIAFLVSALLWLFPRLVSLICRVFGWQITEEKVFAYELTFLLLLGIFLAGKKMLWPYGITPQTKIIVLTGVAALALVLSWRYSDKAVRWIYVVQERITPLVWLFMVFVILSLPIVAYNISWERFGKGVTAGVSGAEVSVKNRPNIILVTFDALTARDMSLYGYDRLTTPFIDEWANTATIFTRVKAASNFTAPTTATLMTGKRVWTHRRFSPLKDAKPVNSEVENLAFELKKNNYYNMAFITNPFATIDSLGMSESFHIAPPYTEFSDPIALADIVRKYLYRLFGSNIKFNNWIVADDFVLSKILLKFSPDYSVTRVPPEKAFQMFLQKMDNKISEPYFAWIHILPPHDPYLPPLPFLGMYNPSSEMKTFKMQKGTGWDADDNFPDEFRSKGEIFRARYNEFIRYCDKQFEEFIVQLRKKMKLSNTIVILSSDHGESFEHNYFIHGGIHLYEQVTHIPLVIKKPGQNDKLIIDSLVDQIDIPATILDLAGIQLPEWMEGRSLVPLLHNEKLPPRPVLSMAVHLNANKECSINNGSFAVWEGDYKLIHYHKFGQGESMLFNLKKDPDELNNLIEKQPEIGQHLMTVIKGKFDKANCRMNKGWEYLY
jgi:arylsulfatase A-like enzyme